MEVFDVMQILSPIYRHRRYFWANVYVIPIKRYTRYNKIWIVGTIFHHTFPLRKIFLSDAKGHIVAMAIYFDVLII